MHSGNYISCAKISQIVEVLRDFPHLFGSRNNRTTGMLHTTRHVYRSVWLAREAKPRFGAAPVRSAHDCEIRLYYNAASLAEYRSYDQLLILIRGTLVVRISQLLTCKDQFSVLSALHFESLWKYNF